MSSSVLHDHISHSLLLPNQPLFCLPPRVFYCVCFVHILTSVQDKLLIKVTKCVFLGYSHFQMGYHCYSLDINRYFISANVTFFEDSSFFSFVACPSVPDVLSISLVLPSPNFPSPTTDVVIRPLQVYTRRPHPTWPLVDSSSMPQSSPAPVLQSYDDLPIAIRKGTHSTSNPHLVHNFFIFYCLYLPYFVFISTLSSVSTPKSTSEALSHPNWKQAMTEEMDALYSNGTWGSLSLFLLTSLLLVVVGFIQ